MNTYHSDPVIDEIREIRHRISEECGHDPAQLVAYYRKLQEQYRDRLIDTTKEPKRDDESARSQNCSSPTSLLGEGE